MYNLLLLSCPSFGLAAIISGQLNLTDIKVLQRDGGGTCSLMEGRERARKDIRQIANSTISQLRLADRNSTNTRNSSNKDTQQQTQNFTACGTVGWRRIAFINMTNTSHNCPAGLNLTSYSKRTCGQSHTSAGCSSTTFRVGSANQYRQVCGRVKAYQLGETTAFGSSNQGIDNHYVDGISLTHGAAGRRQHIWTFAAGLAEVTTHWREYGCPCDTGYNDRIPNFVGYDYFCESGVNHAWSNNLALHPDDVLWDGRDCTSTSTCCQLNNPPWFTKNLTSATTDDIEMWIDVLII